MEYYAKYEDIRRFIFQSLIKVDVCEKSSRTVSDGLSETSLFGIDSHGIKLFPHYFNAVKNGRVNKNPSFTFKSKHACAGVLDGDHSFGHHSGTEAMRRAIKMAKEFGLGAVSVSNSSHFGAAGFFAIQAAREDMIGLGFTHADSLMLSKFGKRPFFGTNPISFCAPVEGEEPFYLDMATTNISWNHVLNSISNDIPLKEGLAVDQNGDMTVDPNIARALQPIGDYKGFALSMMVEILCSLLTEMPFGRDITSMYKTPIDEHRKLGHFFLVLNIAAFTDVDSFKVRLKSMMDELRKEPPKETTSIMCPGDPQKNFKKERLAAGIPIFKTTWEGFEAISSEIAVELPTLL